MESRRHKIRELRVRFPVRPIPQYFLRLLLKLYSKNLKKFKKKSRLVFLTNINNIEHIWAFVALLTKVEHFRVLDEEKPRILGI